MTTAMQPAHSELGASSMHRWANCPGSVALSRGVPKTTSKYAEEGTLAHEVAADILLGNPYKQVPQEMLDAVMVYVELVREESKHCQLLVEHRFDLSRIHPGCFGTADAVVYNKEKKHLKVFDYKHGQGVAVDVEENEQLMYYGLGALLSLGVPCTEVELVIVQPRCSHPGGVIRRWRFEASRLIDFAQDVSVLASRTQDSNAPLVPGSWCRFCPASGICPEVEKQALAAAQAEFSPTLSYDPKKLSDTLHQLDVVEAWIKGVRDFAYNEASHGRCPPGWKLVQKRATRKWKSTDHTELAEDLRQAFKLPIDSFYTEPELKSPPQVEKLLAKGKKKDLERFVESVSSGTTLVPDSDDRPAARTDAASEFSVIEAEFTHVATDPRLLDLFE